MRRPRKTSPLTNDAIYTFLKRQLLITLTSYINALILIDSCKGIRTSVGGVHRAYSDMAAIDHGRGDLM
jgi:hypothetical protein